MWFLTNTQRSSDIAEPERKPQRKDVKVEKLMQDDQSKPVTVPARTVYDESQAIYVTLIFFAAIVLRVLLFVLGPASDNTRAMYPDSYRYVELGETLFHQGAYGLSSAETGVVHEPLYQLREELGQLEPPLKNGLRPEIMRTPGYPSLLGASGWMGLGLNGVLLLQCLFSALSVTLVYAIGRALLQRPGPALFAAAIVAIHPADIAAPSAILTETCFTLLILLGLWSVSDREKRGIGSTTFGGLAIGLSVLVRPVSILLGPAVALWMIATDRKLKTFVLAFLMLALSIAPGAAWMARNKNIGFGYRLSSIPYINSYFYGDAYMRITEQGGDWKEDWPATVNTLMGELRAEENLHSEANIFDTMKSLSIEAIKEKPRLYAQVLKESMIKFFTDHSLGGMYQQLGLTYTPSGLRDKLMADGFSWASLSESLKNPTGWLALLWVVFNCLLLLGMVLGTAMLLVRRQWAALLLLGGVMFYFAFATQTTGLERFRLPVLGIQALLAASIFAPRILKEKKAKKPKRRWYEEDDDAEDESASEANEAQTENVEAEPEPESLARPI